MIFGKKLYSKLSRRMESIDASVGIGFSRVNFDIKHINSRISNLISNHSELLSSFNRLRKHFSELNVAKRLKALEEEQLELRRAINVSSQVSSTESETVKRLKSEVFGKQKDSESVFWNSNRMMNLLYGQDLEVAQEPTLAGKVDAIIEHLGIDVSVQPEKTTASKVIVNKVKKGKK